jgi:raffinose/stachyose/melibiose transport system substrate-binding protein
MLKFKRGVYMKKIKLFLLLLVTITALLVILFSGCKIGKPKDVTVQFWHLDTQDDFKAVWQAQADAFMAENPNVTIEITVLENEAFKQKLATVMQSGDPPDIFRSWGGGVMNEYAEAGLLKDISKDLKGEWGNSIGKGALGVYGYKGKYYGAPYDMGAVGIWYNKAIFAEAGVEPFETWSDLLEGCKKIKAAGYIPIAVGEGDRWPGHFWWVYLAARIGGQEAFLKASSREGSFTDEPFVKAGEELKKLVDIEPFQKGFLGATYNDEALLVAQRKAAMELMGQWAINMHKQNTDDKQGLGDDLGFMPFPAVEGGAGAGTDAMGGGNGLIIGKNAPKEAVEFLKFMLTMENYKKLVQSPLNLVPTVKGAEEYVQDPFMRQIASMVAEAEYYQLYYDQYLPPAVGQAVLDATQGIFARTKTPQDAAQLIEDAMAEETD